MRIQLCLLFIFTSLFCQVSSAALKNQLKNNPSPYLAMHSKDPVAWQTWSPETLALARRENKLLFVSVGYFSCYWCHVMQHESYSDARIADWLNKHFIPVVVDRELNSALDAYLMNFMERTSGQGGWPLNVFVTPEGNPVVGTLYQPADKLLAALQQVDKLWQNNAAALRTMASKAAAELAAESVNAAPLAKDAGRQLINAFVQQALANADELSGGFGEQSKFPMISQLRVMLYYYDHLDRSQREKQSQLAQFLQTTLDHMASQGLRDQLGGGFFRYTTDPTWQTPHYEKMLYDNAGMALLYLEAAAVFGRKDYRAIGRNTLDFMLHDMKGTDGAMVSSLSAVDGANVEGGYYVWDKASLHKLLSKKEYNAVALLWGLDRAPDVEAGFLPKQMMSVADVAKKLKLSQLQVQRLISLANKKLLKARELRTLPVDTKQLAGWNGLALSAFAHGATLKHGEKYHAAGQRIRSYIVKRLWNGQQLARAVKGKTTLGQAGLEDYAFVAQGIYDWGKANNNKKDLPLVRQWLNYAWLHFYSEKGWLNSDATLIKAGPAVAVMEDNALPSASSALLSTSWRMAVLDGDVARQQQVKTALALGQELLQQQPFYYANQIALLVEVQAAEVQPTGVQK